MKQYQSLFIVDPAKENSLETITSGIKEAITKNNGTVEKEENWGKQRLSFAVKKSQEGIYYKLEFSIDPSEIDKLSRSYKLNQDILRTMITVK